MDATRRPGNGLAPETIAAETPDGEPTLGFSVKERCALLLLRRRYQQSHDVFSDAEVARLRFLRWLHQSGAFAS